MNTPDHERLRVLIRSESAQIELLKAATKARQAHARAMCRADLGSGEVVDMLLIRAATDDSETFHNTHLRNYLQS